MIKNIVVGVSTFILIVALIFALCMLSAAIIDSPSAQAQTVTIADSGLVGDNLMPNVDFSSDISRLKGTDYRLQGLTFGGWYFNYTDTVYDDAVILKRNNDHKVVLSNTSSQRANLHFDLGAYFIQSNTTYTLTFGLNVVSSPWFGIAVEKRNLNTYGSSLGGRSWSSFTSGDLTYSLTFTTGTIDPTFNYSIALKVDPQSEIICNFTKLERGSNFTGFVPKSYTNYGYDDGIDDAFDEYYEYVDGYTSSTVFYDFPSSELSVGFFSSQDGNINYSAINGAEFTPDSSLTYTNFFFNDGSTPEYTLSPQSYTLSIGYKGTFNLYDVYVSCIYSNSGFDVTLTQFLDPSKNVFTFTFNSTSLPYLYSFGVASTVLDFSCFAFKVEDGEYFTRFPVGGTVINEQSAYNLGFSAGQVVGNQEGYADGYTEGQTFGYSSGFNEGKTQGISQGYTEGLSVAQNGTWSSLFSGLIDVPVRTFTGLLNYDILGINMWNFIKTVLMISLAIFLVRFFLH